MHCPVTAEVLSEASIKHIEAISSPDGSLPSAALFFLKLSINSFGFGYAGEEGLFNASIRPSVSTITGQTAFTLIPDGPSSLAKDCVRPFTAVGAGCWTIVLALTSNVGAQDFEFHGDPPLYERVLEKAQAWGTPDNMMFVVGATRPQHLARARALAPDHFFLVPGVGAQGGTLEDVVKAGWNRQCGLLVNSSRGILYASPDSDFAEKAREAALELQNSMARCLKATT